MSLAFYFPLQDVTTLILSGDLLISSFIHSKSLTESIHWSLLTTSNGSCGQDSEKTAIRGLFFSKILAPGTRPWSPEAPESAAKTRGRRCVSRVALARSRPPGAPQELSRIFKGPRPCENHRRHWRNAQRSTISIDFYRFLIVLLQEPGDVEAGFFMPRSALPHRRSRCLGLALLGVGICYLGPRPRLKRCSAASEAPELRAVPWRPRALGLGAARQHVAEGKPTRRKKDDEER